MQSTTIYDQESASNEIGQLIHDAKRRLLDSYKKGVPLTDAAATFHAEVDNAITRASAQLGTPASAERNQPTPASTTETETSGDDPRVLDEAQLKYVCEHLGLDADGSHMIGLTVLLLEHVAALSMKSGDVESQIAAIGKSLLKHNAAGRSAARVAAAARSHMDDLIAESQKGGSQQ